MSEIFEEKRRSNREDILVEYKKVSDILGKDGTILKVCSSDSKSLKVFFWQPSGEFIADNSNGVILEKDDFIDKAKSFIKIAKEKCAELVLTPEYSFPYKVLDDIIENKDLWPEKGWLWCFGTQGDNKNRFENRMNAWAKIPNVSVENYSFQNLSSNVFVCPLIYLFRRNNDRLCILPQFKVGHMRDPWHVFEANDLCIGNVIFVFDLNGRDICRNSFLSIICADVFRIRAENILDNVLQENIIVFHPQLNKNPRHVDFLNFRSGLISNHGKKVRIITLNWAEGTKAHFNGKIEEFNMPFSAFYTRTSYKMENETHRSLRRKNFKKGLFYAYNKKSGIDIWYSHRSEHCKLLFINKEFFDGRNPGGDLQEPITKECFIFDNESKKWKIDDLPCKYDLKSFLENDDEEYNFPLQLCMNNDGKCSCEECQLDICDFFFSLCFGENEESELIADNELTERLIMGSDEESNKKRRHKITHYNQLINQLKKNNFPLSFEHFKDNHKFEIYNGYPNIGTEVYNLVQRCLSPENNDLKAIVSITKNKHTEDEIKTLIDSLSERMNERYRKQVLVYYEPIDGSPLTYYDKHLLQSEITKPTFSYHIASIHNTEFI